MNAEILLQLCVATAAGLVIGLERGWYRREKPEGGRVAGIRTFGVAGLLGGLCMVLGQGQLVLLAAAGLGVFALLVVTYYLGLARGSDVGITTELALVATLLMGALATRHALAALGTAALLAVILGFKRELHRSLEFLERRELLATLQLVLIAALAIPLLPDRGMGPWHTVNPRAIGLLVLLILGISYVGYFFVRLLGARTGLLATAILGGLTSSTAVTLTYARMGRVNRTAARLLGAGIALACATMTPRLLIEVSVVQPGLVTRIWLPLAVLGGVPLAFAVLIARTSQPPEQTKTVKLTNPLDLESALILGLGLTVIIIAARGAQQWLGDAGIYSVALLSGLIDVDAIAVALAQQAGTAVSEAVAARGILLAAIGNTVIKAGLAFVVGGRELFRWCGPILVLAALAAAAVVWMP